MVAGATGIDLFLLVVDAAEGARPQTHEHLAILRLLGDRRAASSRSRRPTRSTTRRSSSRSRKRASSFRARASSPVSAQDRRRARRAAGRARRGGRRGRAPPAATRRRRASTSTAPSRCAGSARSSRARSGRVDRRGRRARVEPRGRDVRVRSVQVHDRPVERAEAGQRVAVALPGIERRELRRGDALVARRAYPVSYRLDVALVTELAISPSRVHVHHGTAESPRASCAVGERYAQLRLAAPVVAARGDRVVLRAARRSAAASSSIPRRRGTPDAERLELLERGEIEATIRRARASRRAATPARRRAAGGRAGERLALLARLARRAPDRAGAALDDADPLDPGVSAAQRAVGGGGRAAARARAARREAVPARRQRVAGRARGRGGGTDWRSSASSRVKLDDAALARLLEERGRLVRLGDGFAISPRSLRRARRSSSTSASVPVGSRSRASATCSAPVAGRAAAARAIRRRRPHAPGRRRARAQAPTPSEDVRPVVVPDRVEALPLLEQARRLELRVENSLLVVQRPSEIRAVGAEDRAAAAAEHALAVKLRRAAGSRRGTPTARWKCARRDDEARDSRAMCTSVACQASPSSAVDAT